MPLAHILLPQLLRKTNEIQAALEPASPPLAGAGYLQQTGADSGNIPKNAKVDSTTPEGAAITALSSMQKLGPAWGGYATGAAAGFNRAADPALRPLPNAPAPAPNQPTVLKLPNGKVATAYLGADTPIATGPHGGVLISMSPDEIAQAQAAGDKPARGAKKGKGYLQRDENARTAERRRTDVSQQDLDPFAQKTLEDMYGPHLKAMQDNYKPGAKKNAFPDGYFDGMSKEERRNIEKGVAELMRRQNQKL